MQLFVFILFVCISVSHHTKNCIIKRLQTLTYFKTLNCISLTHHMVDSWSISIQKWKNINSVVGNDIFFLFRTWSSSFSFIEFYNLIQGLSETFRHHIHCPFSIANTFRSDQAVGLSACHIFPMLLASTWKVISIYTRIQWNYRCTLWDQFIIK